MNLDTKLKTLRKKKGLSQQDLAEAIGVHFTHINRIENGKAQPSVEILRKLMDLYEVSADYLFNDEMNNYETQIKDKSLAEKIRLIDTLDEHDRDALSQVIDSMLTKQKMKILLSQEVSIA